MRTCLPFDAIHVDPIRKLAVVDEEKCQGCEKCVAVCPKHVLSMKPVDRKVSVVCSSHDKAKDVKERCKVGCIGCTKCEKVCKFGAITMENNLPVIDYTKCVGCMMCAESCPTGALWGDLENRFIAEIDPDACVGCTLCKKQCEFDAILGELKQKHKVLDACTGCGKCAVKCPKKAISMRERHTPRDAMATATNWRLRRPNKLDGYEKGGPYGTPFFYVRFTERMGFASVPLIHTPRFIRRGIEP